VSFPPGYVITTPLCSWRPSCWTHRISAGSCPDWDHSEIGEGTSSLRCDPKSKKHLRPFAPY
jgi:hypothetical protein